MTPNQQEEMEKELSENFLETHPQFDVFDEGKVTNDSYRQLRMETLDTFSEGFEAAYTLQQEKIEKLEKLCGVHFNENGMHEIEAYEKQIESLKSDLDWATNLISLGSWEYSNHNDCHNKAIRQRHNLDKSEEV